MLHLLYIAGLLAGIAGLMVIDWRYKLAFWYDTKRTAVTIGTGMSIFIIWDLIGIYAHIFFKGTGEFMLPFEIVPEFPIEELFFLFLLCYVTLLLYRGSAQWRHIL